MSGSGMVASRGAGWKVVVVGMMVVAATAFGMSSAYGDSEPEGDDGVLAFGPGEVCAFAVTLTPQDGARETVTELADGRVRIRMDADYVVTNDDTGGELLHRSHYTTIEEETDNDELRFTTTGRGIVFLFAGDAGPDGEVGEDGGLYAISGRLVQTFDEGEDLITSFALRGRAVDLCAALSG